MSAISNAATSILRITVSPPRRDHTRPRFTMENETMADVLTWWQDLDEEGKGDVLTD